MFYLLSAFLFALHKREGHIAGRCLCSSFGDASVMFTDAFGFWLAPAPHRSHHRGTGLVGQASAPALFCSPPCSGCGVARDKGRVELCVNFTLLPTSVGSSRKAVSAAVVSAESRISSFPGAQPWPRSDCAFEASQNVKQYLYLKGLASLKTPKTK